MSGKRINPHRHAVRTSGFTLIEMLVSTVLVMMMMIMFSTVFQIAASSMATQRGLAENDQRARTLTTVIKADLNHRTFLNLIAYNAGELPPPVGTQSFIDRRGYFYVSENSIDDDSDDVLQFTIEVTANEEPFFGKVVDLGAIGADFNQPQWDDGDSTNGAASSRFAEVSYFLRNGTLFRRVLLIRDPLFDMGFGAQPTDAAGAYFFDATYTGNLWDDFDYSAFFSATLTAAQFHSAASLDNTVASATAVLAKPLTRFGHDHATGAPLEFIGADFIGRYTQEETSHDDFGYPGLIPGPGSPMDSTTPLTFANGLVDEFKDGPRRAEDILMTNVHSFDVKLWDPGLGDFVDVGSGTGDFAVGNNQNAGYGNRFDTWHPNIDLNGDTTLDPPPYAIIDPGPDSQPGNANVDDDGINGIDDAGELGFQPSDDRGIPAIQITIRFHDVSSDQVRQLTLIHSLTK